MPLDPVQQRQIRELDMQGIEAMNNPPEREEKKFDDEVPNDEDEDFIQD